ncbi:MAG TPA: GFA family protein [Solirubrobacteraceae bacterium]|nr:GFA family protein [Solirubrobacteraceae bacterium]
MSDLPLTGHCLCGGVRFEITRPLGPASYCHCTRCQRRTGTAASAQAQLEPGSLRILAGEDLVRAYEPPGGWAKLFCVTCGSALFSRAPGDPERMSVRLGVVDGDPGVRPRLRHHVATAAVWEPLPDDGLPRFPDAVT